MRGSECSSCLVACVRWHESGTFSHSTDVYGPTRSERDRFSLQGQATGLSSVQLPPVLDGASVAGGGGAGQIWGDTYTVGRHVEASCRVALVEAGGEGEEAGAAAAGEEGRLLLFRGLRVRIGVNSVSGGLMQRVCMQAAWAGHG